MSGLLSVVCLGIGFAVCLGFALVHYQDDEPRTAILWGCGSAIFAAVGVAAYALSTLPSDHGGDGELRPYLGVSALKATIEIGKPVSMQITFTAKGKSQFAYGVTDGRIRSLDNAIWARNNETDDPPKKGQRPK